jgi:long-chain acyl-CoA synthetase
MAEVNNLASLAEQAFDSQGDRDILFLEGTWYRSGDIHARATRIGRGFQELGVEPGDRVVVMMSNCPEVGIVYEALWRAGAAITPAIFLLPPDELHHILVDSEARAIVTTPEFLPTVAQAAEGVDTLKWTLCLGTEQDGIIPLESLEGAEAGTIVDRDPEDLAALMYTGGTTGRAKGVMLTHENLWWSGLTAYKSSHVEGITRVLMPLPLSHSYGLLVSVVGMHTAIQGEPGDAVLMRWFDPQGWVDLAEEHRVHVATMVPTMLQMLLPLPLEEHDLSSLRYIVSGASPLSIDVVKEFERKVPSVEIRQGYGLTETAAGLTLTPAGARKLGSVGVPYEGFDVRIVDEERGEIPQGEVGEVTCRSKSVMKGYWKDPDGTANTIRDGWLYTGDMGYLDEDRNLFIVDRKKDLIIRGGFNVYPRDVEDALVEHPAVAVAGVVGKEDPVKGEEVVAFVQLTPGQETTEEELIEFSKEKLGRYKYPREIRTIDQIPLTPVFKIDRKKLRTLL